MPPPLTWSTAFTATQFAPVVTGIESGLLLLYLFAAYRVRRRHPGHPWPRRRTAAFVAGLLVLAAALQSSIAVYDDTLFWLHMVQHLLLLMVAPPLLLLGRPITLLLHAFRNPVHRWLLRVVRSRLVSLLTHPLVGLVLYTATVVGTHLTGFMNVVLQHEWAHQLEHVLFVVVGYLFFLPLVGREPIRWRLSRPLQVLMYVLAMPADTFTGLVLTQATHEPFPAYAANHPAWAPAPLADLHAGGAVMWIGGDAVMFLLVLLAVFGWARQAQADTGRWLEAARADTFDRLTGAAPTRGVGARSADTEDRLAAYNAYLARLHGRRPVSGERPDPPTG